jgi:hypothetical protein
VFHDVLILGAAGQHELSRSHVILSGGFMRVTPFRAERRNDWTHHHRTNDLNHHRMICFHLLKMNYHLLKMVSDLAGYNSFGFRFFEEQIGLAGHRFWIRYYFWTEVNSLENHCFFPLVLAVEYIWAGHPACCLMAVQVMAGNLRMAAHHPLVGFEDMADIHCLGKYQGDPEGLSALVCQYLFLVDLV